MSQLRHKKRNILTKFIPRVLSTVSAVSIVSATVLSTVSAVSIVSAESKKNKTLMLDEATLYFEKVSIK